MNQPEESPKSLQQDENCEKEKSVNPEIEGKISTTLDQILTRSTDDPERKGEIFQLIRKVVTAKYSGPLPPPEMIRLYNQYIPGSADRIITMAEKEQEHRHNCDNRDLNIADSQIKSFNDKISRGQWMD